MPMRFLEVAPASDAAALHELAGFVPKLNFTLPAFTVQLKKPPVTTLYAVAGAVALFLLNLVVSRYLARKSLREFGKTD